MRFLAGSREAVNHSDLVISRMSLEQWDEVATLIHDSTNGWYETQGRSKIFCNGTESTRLFCEVYEALDPGCCLIAQDPNSKKIIGSCFYHPRPTHLSLGIMNVDPESFGCGIAMRLLKEIVAIAQQDNLPVRLVSSLMNLDSFSLYNRSGFQPMVVYQDMYLDIPETGLDGLAPDLAECVRLAQMADVPRMVDLEMEICGLDRGKDFELFVTNEGGIWNTLVIENPEGQLMGFLSAVRHPGSNMIGPGVARDESYMSPLIWKMFDFHRSNSPVVLIPSACCELVQTMYRWGARNCELHVSQCLGEWAPPGGIVLPTFMPETG